MNYQELEELNKEFAIETAQMQEEFTELFARWLKKSPRLTIVSVLSLPIGIILSLMEKNDGLIEEIFPELPDAWGRYLQPWMILRQKWGKISSKEFIKQYGELHGSQYEAWFPSVEEKKTFEEWFKAQNKSK